MKGMIMLMMVGFLNPTLWGAIESELDAFKQTLSEYPTLEARSAYFKRLEPSQKEAIKYSLNSYVTNYESYNDFFHGMGSLCVQTIRKKGYGDVFDILVNSGDPFYVMLRVAEEYWRYCSTKEEAALDEATRLYQQTIEQQYPYTGAYLLGTLGGVKDGWAARYMEWWDDSDPEVQAEAEFMEYWAIQYRLKPAYFEEKERFFQYLKSGIQKLYNDLQAIKEEFKRKRQARREQEEAERRKPPEQKADESQQRGEKLWMVSLDQISAQLRRLESMPMLTQEQTNERTNLLRMLRETREDIQNNLTQQKAKNLPVGRAYLDFAIAEGIIPAEERDQYRIREEDPMVVGEASEDRKRSRDDDASGAGAAE